MTQILTKIIEIEYQPISDDITNYFEDESLENLKQKTIKQIKQAYFEPEDLLFRGFNIRRLKRVLKKGTDRTRFSNYIGCYAPRSAIYASDGDGTGPYNLQYSIGIAYNNRKQGLLTKLFGGKDEFTVSCYDKSKFAIIKHDTYQIKKGYTFLDALKAIIIYKPKKGA
jgi:hypothetical protein